MSKFGGHDFILVIQDRSRDKHRVGVDKPAITFESKQIITDAAMNYATWKSIPRVRRFSTRARETVDPPDLITSFKGLFASAEEKAKEKPNPNVGKFSPLVGKPLSRLTEKDKLFIFGHGNTVGLAWMADHSAANLASQENALALAKLLSDHGLRRVGLITFKSCLVGRGDFLKQFARALAVNGIAAGWLKGYKGIADTVPRDDGGYTEEISKKIKGGRQVLTYDIGAAPEKVMNNDRYRIVRGPGKIFEGKTFGRYAGTTTAEDLKLFED